MKTAIIILETTIIAFFAGVVATAHMLENDKEAFEDMKKKWNEKENPA